MSESTDGRFGLATINDGGTQWPAVVTDRGVAPLATLLHANASSSVRGLLADWDGWCDRIAAALAGGRGTWTAPEDLDFAPPLPDPANLYAAGANFYDHIAEMKAHVPDKSVDEVFHFTLPTGSLVGTGHEVLRPAGVQMLDWEVELAVVIGRYADSVKADDALDHVAGYAVANDVSVRDASHIHPIFGVKFLFAKGQRTLTPMGPAIVPARFVSDPDELAMTTHVNGVVRQDSSTTQMIWSVREQIAFLSGRTPLVPGDVILTGTPAGTAAAHGAYIADGDVVTCAVHGLGAITNTVVGSRS